MELSVLSPSTSTIEPNDTNAIALCDPFSTPTKVSIEEPPKNTPSVGMTFESVEEFEEFYNKYALANGFRYRRRSSMEGYLRWVCRKAGYNNIKPKQPDATGKIKRKSSSVRVGCQNTITLKLDRKCEKWFIYSFTATHNHGVVTPNKAHFVPKGVTMEESGQHVIEMFKDHGIPVGKVATLFGKGRFTKRNCYNHLRDVRTKVLDIGDAQSVLEYCEEQSALDPRFFYRIQIDDEGRMSNFFWVDARSRKAYQIFGDAIVFDTTYRTNRYEMPLAPFTGVDNHKQSILFGCALLMDEQEETFVWLFRTWLEAMEGKEPISIITDQDKSISNAIHVVFPLVRHRFCIWHILKKFPKLEDRYEAMRHEDYVSRHKNRSCDQNSFLEEHAAEVYTRKVYLEFYSQLFEVGRYMYTQVKEYVGPGEQFIVRHVTNHKEFYIVDLDMQSIEKGIVNSVTCSCGYFVWNGVLCRHILKIFTCHNVIRIPDQYILHRWCKDASRPLDIFTRLNAEEKGQVAERVLSLNYLAAKVASMACKDNGKYELAVSMYKQVIEKIENFVDGKDDVLEGEVGEASRVGLNPISPALESRNTEISSQVLMNPNISHTKGRKKQTKRLKSSLEVATNGQRRCGICKLVGHNAATCKKKKAEDVMSIDAKDGYERRSHAI